MTHPAQPYPAVTVLIDQLAGLVQRWRARSEISELDYGEFHRIAREMGLSSAGLEELVSRGTHAADELPRLLKALGFDDAAIARIEQPVFNDMRRVCANCEHKPECRHDLAAGALADHYPAYCANAVTIGGLAVAAK
ncbi:MAG: hypothetical protein H7312_24085 [Tardiphaga sp.]|nr:hypothetical protein [Tardiphaga sp.]